MTELMESITEIGRYAKDDPRWQLVDRILSTEPFQKSKRYQVLLRYMVDRGLAGKPEDLSEKRIGQVIFGKGEDYATFEDSTVRVHVRQLRFKLQEYFSGEGKFETLILEIPKGSYGPYFRTSVVSPLDTLPHDPSPIFDQVAASVAPPQRTSQAYRWATFALATLSVSLICALAVLLAKGRSNTASEKVQSIPWPLSSVFDTDQGVRVVVADANYGILRVASGKSYTLEQYLESSKSIVLPNDHTSLQEADLARYLSYSNLTSLADLMVATKLVETAAQHHVKISIRSQRDLQPRDLTDGNYVFLGSPASNLWVTLFQDQFNFVLVDNPSDNGEERFRNRSPLPNEQAEYHSISDTGSGADDYADIVILPATQHHGKIMILQGLHQGATEAAGLFLANEGNQQALKNALHFTETKASSNGFEILIRTRVVRGSPDSASIVATRILR